MPELFDIDRAFDALTHDVATRTHAPGAAHVTRAARRRRTTRLVGAVAALAVVAGGGVGLLEQRSDRTVVDPAGDLPAPAPLSTSVLDAVTAGWISGWVVPTDQSQISDTTGQTMDRCVNSLLRGDETDTPVSTGAAIFVAGKALVFARGGQASSDAEAEHVMAQASPGSGCQDVRTTSPSTDTELVTASVAGGGGVFAVVRWHDRLAYAGLAAPDTAPAGVQDALGRALLAAVQDDAIVTTMPPILQGSMGGAQSQSATSSDATAYSMTDPAAQELQSAFGAWAPGYSTQPASDMADPPDCFPDTASSSSGATVGNRAVVSLSNYPSAAAAQQALAANRSALASCGFTTVGPTGDLVVATKGGAHATTLWFLRSDSHVAWIQVDGWADPPQAVTDAVEQLLTAAAATIHVEPSGPATIASAKAGG